MNPEDIDGREFALRLMFVSLVLGLAMLVPFVLLENYYAGLAAFLVGGAYMVIRTWLNGRGKPKGKRPPRRVGWFLVLNGLGGTAASMGLAGLIMVSWLRWAYTDTASGEYAAVLAGLRNWSFDWPLSMLLASVALSGFSLICVKRPEDGATSVGQRIRDYGPVVFHGTWMSSFAGSALLLAALQFAGPPVALEFIMEQLTIGREREFADLLVAFPVVPLSVFTAAILFVVASVDLPDWNASEALVLGYVEGEPDGSAGTGIQRRVATVINLGGYVAAVALTIHLLHFGIVLAIGSTQALLPSASVGGALETWVLDQLIEKHPENEIVETINQAGYWSPDAPGQRLTELLPDLEGELAGLNLDKSCRITVAAATVDLAEQELIKWPEDDEPDDFETILTKEPADSLEHMTVKFCVKATCPVPTAWDAPPAISLWSSHPSANRNWMYWASFDLYANGVAPEPGGYCNADGTLADEYQG